MVLFFIFHTWNHLLIKEVCLQNHGLDWDLVTLIVGVLPLLLDIVGGLCYLCIPLSMSKFSYTSTFPTPKLSVFLNLPTLVFIAPFSHQSIWVSNNVKVFYFLLQCVQNSIEIASLLLANLLISSFLFFFYP